MSFVAALALILGSIAQAAPSYYDSEQRIAEVTIDGWKTECVDQIRSDRTSSQCEALFELGEGFVLLRFSSKDVHVQISGIGCEYISFGEAESKLPVGRGDVSKLIERAAASYSGPCRMPTLSAEMFKDVEQVSALLSKLTYWPL